MVLGKFLPPTAGHRYLVDFARSYCDDLTVIVGTLQREPIPGALRFQWMREMFPDANVVHLAEEIPQTPDEHPDFWNIWHRAIRQFIPEGPDYVFASEEYGFKLAEILGAEYIPVDHARELVPIAASTLLADPMQHWDFLPPCTRPYFVRRVCIMGSESTGKTTLARDLARHFRTPFVVEYARPLIDTMRDEVSQDTFEVILKGQAASEAALARQANRVLICDTDAFTTALFHEMFYGTRPAYIVEEAERRHYDLYLLSHYEATPYADDPQRNHEHMRPWFHDECLAWLAKRDGETVVLGGSWEERLDTARDAVQRLINKKA